MTETAQNRANSATPPLGTHCLADFRRDIAGTMRHSPRSQRERLKTAVNEVVANLFRHAHPVPTEIAVHFEHVDGVACCIVRDNGGSFATFASIWDMIRHRGNGPLFTASCVGLSMVQRFFPNATYVPKNARSKYNMFVLPLDDMACADLPAFFRSH